MKLSSLTYFLRKNLEAIIWTAALVSLVFLEPGEHHHSLCLFSNLGFSYCPGCGLGRSIAHFYHGNIMESIRCHPLGIPAVLILSFRIITLIRQSIKNNYNITNN